MSNQVPFVCAVFGAPGVGKTSLMNELDRRGARASSKLLFATLREPTDSAAMQQMLALQYKEAQAGGTSATFEIQKLIMVSRSDMYRRWMANECARLQAEAERQGKTLVVLCDGHVRTDALLYAQSKADAGQMTPAQFRIYKSMLATECRGLSDAFANPQLYCHIFIGDDTDGSEHYRRVVLERQTEAERTLDKTTFARFVRYASMTAKRVGNKRLLSMDSSVTNCTRAELVDQFVAKLESEVVCQTRVASESPPGPMWCAGGDDGPRLASALCAD